MIEVPETNPRPSPGPSHDALIAALDQSLSEATRTVVMLRAELHEVRTELQSVMDALQAKVEPPTPDVG